MGEGFSFRPLTCRTLSKAFHLVKYLYIYASVYLSIYVDGAFQVALVVKNPPASAGDVKDAGSIPGLGRPAGGGHGSPLQYSCPENPMNRGDWGLQFIGSQRVGHD